ncbi:MAG: DUF655 domain-containing protein [Candidatus Diapherotrites archaeon]
MKAEDYALVLDFLPKGRSTDYKSEPICIVLGKNFFTLLEVVPKPNIDLKPQEEVYIGKEQRDKIDFIKRRINYKDLTTNAINELESAIEKVVAEREQFFVNFFNKSTAISLKRHQLELLPGLGKKHLSDILSERQKMPFSSFADIKQRVSGIDPIVFIKRRIIEELQGQEEKFYLFTRAPIQEKPFFKKRF